MISLSKQHIATIKDAAKKLTGAIRREFQVQVSIDYLKSKPHLAEKIFGWDRKTRLSHKNLTCLSIDSRVETESAKLSKAT
jgi:hypothetical protein